MEVPVRAQDELGQLARAFKAMAGRLRELISSLEERVAARTRDLEERAVQLRASAEVGRAIATIRDLDALLPEVTRLISERFGFYHVGIFLLDEAGQKAVLRAANSRGGKEMLEAGHSLQVGEQGIVGYVTQMGKPRIALDVGEDAVHFRNPYLPETHSEVALPLMLGDRILGALDVQSRETGAFDEDDVAVLQVLADQVVVAIENARLFTEMEKAVEAERRAYGEISRAAWSEILRARAIEGYYSDEGGVYALGPHRSIPRVDDDGMELLEIPVKERDVLVGTIEVRKPAGAGGWTESERELLETLAARVGAALENARLYEDSVRRTLRERMVSEISDRLRSSTDVEGVLRATVAELGRTLGALGTIRMVPAEDGGDGRDRE
jgi:GAF domain-containing protein